MALFLPVFIDGEAGGKMILLMVMLFTSGGVSMDKLPFELLMKTLWISGVEEGSQLCHGQAGCSGIK